MNYYTVKTEFTLNNKTFNFGDFISEQDKVNAINSGINESYICNKPFEMLTDISSKTELELV